MKIDEVNGFKELDEYQKNKLTIIYAQHMYRIGFPDYYNVGAINEVGWDKEKHDIMIRFKNGHAYRYKMTGERIRSDEEALK